MSGDEFEWRLAEVRQINRTLAWRFQVCVHTREGKADEAFLEWYWKDSEGPPGSGAMRTAPPDNVEG